MVMLRPIPKRILSQTMTLHVPSAMDTDQNVTYTDTVVSHVHFQSDHRTIKQKDNTEIQTTGVLFIDPRYSRPALDYLALSAQAEAIGAQLRVTIDDQTLTILNVDAVPDDTGRLHHWEVTTV